MSVRVEVVGGAGTVLLVTLDRASKRNAVDHPTLLELLDLQRRLGPDATAAMAQVRVVVITGAPPAFSAGADLTGVELGEFTADLAAVLQGFGSLPMPVIAAIDGSALGAGAQLAVAADLRVATPNSVIGVPAAKLGLVVDHWTVRRFADEFSPPVARAMLLGAETYTAERLHASGGIHRLGGLDHALAWADQLAALAPLTIAGHKLALEHRATEPPTVESVEEARAAAWASNDAVEGRTAFLEKRPAHFIGT
jgi:enoyl-CoA hydratase